jgi:hypothetical protein
MMRSCKRPLHLRTSMMIQLLECQFHDLAASLYMLDMSGLFALSHVSDE